MLCVMGESAFSLWVLYNVCGRGARENLYGDGAS